MTQPWKEKNCESGSILREGRERSEPYCWRKCWLNLPAVGRQDSSHLYELSYNRGPGKELGNCKTTTNWRNLAKVKRRERCQSIRPTNLPESSSLEFILCSHVHYQEGPQSEWLGRDNPETNPHYHKTQDCKLRQNRSPGSLPCCSLPGHPFPIKSFALLAQVSPQTPVSECETKPTL